MALLYPEGKPGPGGKLARKTIELNPAKEENYRDTLEKIGESKRGSAQEEESLFSFGNQKQRSIGGLLSRVMKPSYPLPPFINFTELRGLGSFKVAPEKTPENLSPRLAIPYNFPR